MNHFTIKEQNHEQEEAVNIAERKLDYTLMVRVAGPLH